MLAALLFFCSPILAQEWQNPANKYLNSYKEYLSATCPIQSDSIKHFVYFSRDRHSIKRHPFLNHNSFAGAQIMYSWKQLEPQEGEYDFSLIEQDVKYLKKYGKKLFVQLQDATFNVKYNPVPDYLLTNKYAGGAVLHYENDHPEGWVAKRWNGNVRERFCFLLQALGERFDGEIEGVNLQETAINIEEANDSDFSEEQYVEGLKINMLELRKAFPNSTTMIYANFIPGEWLPWEDKGYLKGIYEYGEEIGVGLGAPDLMVTRKGQLNHALAQMHEGVFSTPIGIAVQDGNYIGKTGADIDYDENDNLEEGRNNIVPMLHAFAKDFLKVDYIFWVDQEPYFEEDVLPCFSKN
jgi:hypothetical protein